MKIINWAVILNMGIGIFNMCIAILNWISSNFQNMVFNLGIAICCFLVATICAIYANNRY